MFQINIGMFTNLIFLVLENFTNNARTAPYIDTYISPIISKLFEKLWKKRSPLRITPGMIKNMPLFAGYTKLLFLDKQLFLKVLVVNTKWVISFRPTKFRVRGGQGSNACVFFTLNRPFYPSTSSTTGARADSSTLEEILDGIHDTRSISRALLSRSTVGGSVFT